MPGFWYPYDSFQDARARLCLFADRTAGSFCGVSLSDGDSLSVLRHPASTPNSPRLWLNVLVQHISVPAPVPAASGGLLGTLKGWFWKAMEIEGQAEIQNAQAQLAASQAVGREFRDHVWEPTHEFLIRHKFAADTAGLALDMVGVVAGGIFLVVAAPELVAVGTVAATVSLYTGGSAAAGSVILFVVDGSIYIVDLAAGQARAAKIEDNVAIQWIRIGATLMLLPDFIVGGFRTLLEIGKLSGEAEEAVATSARISRATEEARARVAKIRNPAHHPGPVNRRLRKVKVLEQETRAQLQRADAMTSRMRLLAGRDLGLFQGATLAGTGLMTAAPPGVVLSPGQNRRDEEYKNSLIPKGGLPRDVRLNVRITSSSTLGKSR